MLKQTCALTIQDSLNHTEITNLVQQGGQQALAINQNPGVDDTTPTIISTYIPTLEEVSAPTSTVSANSKISDITIQAIQQQMQMVMQQMMEMIQTLSKQKKVKTMQLKSVQILLDSLDLQPHKSRISHTRRWTQK